MGRGSRRVGLGRGGGRTGATTSPSTKDLVLLVLLVQQTRPEGTAMYLAETVPERLIVPEP